MRFSPRFHRYLARWRRHRRDDRGQVTAFLVVIAATVVLFAGLLLDGGLALSAKTRAIGLAQEAARAGAQKIDLVAFRADGTLRLVPADAITATHAYLAAAGTTGTVGVQGNTVTATVTITQDTKLLGLVGLGSLTVTGHGSAHPVQGISTAETGPPP